MAEKETLAEQAIRESTNWLSFVPGKPAITVVNGSVLKDEYGEKAA